jgi:HEAT repeat protein
MSVSALVEQLYSVDKAARMLAIRSLGQIGAGARTAVADLVELVDGPDKEIASLSLRALAVIGPSKSLESMFIERLRDPCPRMRQAAAFALGAMGEDGRDAVPTLASMLKDEDRGVQMHAMLALSRVAKVQT